MSPLSFHNGWTDRNADCCVSTVYEKNATTTNFVNFAPVTPEILWLIYMCGDCREANIRTEVVKGHPLDGNSIAGL